MLLLVLIIEGLSTKVINTRKFITTINNTPHQKPVNATFESFFLAMNLILSDVVVDDDGDGGASYGFSYCYGRVIKTLETTL